MGALPVPRQASADEIVRGLVPTPRFAHVSFETYAPDPAYPSQQAALTQLRQFTVALGASRAGPIARWFGRPSTPAPRAIYLDGGYGVGKTHLLAATYHATRAAKRYLSFAELAYTIGRLGMPACLAAFDATRLVCIDEFELDDVAQTRMASMFLRRLLDQGSAHVVTTSNTLPTDLGQGRFAAEAFQREIGELAALFEVVSIDGEDYRHRHWDDLDRAELVDAAEIPKLAHAGVLIDWQALLDELEQLHPVHYGQLAKQLNALLVRGIEPIEDQAVALRWVHFVDKLYDQQVGLTISSRGELRLADVFSPSYRDGGYEKKYRRCLSRLHELLSETTTQRLRRSTGPAAPPAADRDARLPDPARAD